MRKLFTVFALSLLFAACAPIPSSDAQETPTTTTQPDVEAQVCPPLCGDEPVDVSTADSAVREQYPPAPPAVVVPVVVEPRFTG